MKIDIDTTKPHIGRIYDYVLGGTQNFEADRQTADQLLKLVPSVPVTARLNRWFLQMVANRWVEEGHSRVLDLGSGLPTQGHINEYIPEGRILFSDNDALTAEYGQEIVKDRPGMRYVHTDVRQPKPLLELAEQFFGEDRRLAIGFIGLSYFLSDEEFRQLVRPLHALCAPGSVLAMSFLMPVPEEGPTAELMKTYTRLVKVNIYPRSPDQVAELLAPWRMIEQAPLEDLLSVHGVLSEEERAINKFEMNGLFAVH